MTDSLTHSLDLLRRAKDGDEVALNRLCERYYERVRRVVRMRLGRGLREMVDSGDILQETFLQAVRAFDGFETRDEASLVNWLCKLAERQIIAAADYHGAQKRDHRRQVALDDGGPTGEDGPGGLIARLSDETRVPLDKLAEKEQAAIVERCMEELDEPLRELILLRDYVGAPWETVAEECGRPSAAAARMMHARAVVELGKLLRARGI